MLSHVGGAIRVEDNTFLASLDGLRSLTRTRGITLKVRYWLWDSDSLESCIVAAHGCLEGFVVWLHWCCAFVLASAPEPCLVPAMLVACLRLTTRCSVVAPLVRCSTGQPEPAFDRRPVERDARGRRAGAGVGADERPVGAGPPGHRHRQPPHLCESWLGLRPLVWPRAC